MVWLNSFSFDLCPVEGVLKTVCRNLSLALSLPMAEKMGSPVDALKGEKQKQSSGNYGRLYTHVTTIKYVFHVSADELANYEFPSMLSELPGTKWLRLCGNATPTLTASMSYQLTL